MSQRVAAAVLNRWLKMDDALKMTYRFVGCITQTTWIHYSSRHVSLRQSVAMVGGQEARSLTPRKSVCKEVCNCIYNILESKHTTTGPS